MIIGFHLEFMALMGIVALGCLVGAATGFGSSTIIMTLAVLLFPIKAIVAVIIPLNVVICLYLVLKYRDGIDARLLFLRIVPLTVLGMPLGLLIFELADTNRMKPFFGAFVILLSIFELWRSRQNTDGPRPSPKLASSAFWLVTGGVIQGLWVTGGPLVAYWASRAIDNKHEFRSTLSALWLILNVILLVSHGVTGTIDLGTAKVSLALIPALMLGIALGERIHHYLPERSFKMLVYIVLLFSGTAILLSD